MPLYLGNSELSVNAHLTQMVDVNTLLQVSSTEVGDIGVAAFPIVSSSNTRKQLNGQWIDQTPYTAFMAKIRDAYKSYPALFCTETEWEKIAAADAHGQCAKFVIDDTTSRLKLPKIIYPVKHATSISDLGTLSSLLEAESSTVGTALPMYVYYIQVALGVDLNTESVRSNLVTNNPYSFGMYMYCDVNINNPSWVEATGQWIAGTIYEELTDWVKEHGVIVTDESSVGSANDTHFIYCSSTGNIRLPLHPTGGEASGLPILYYYVGETLVDTSSINYSKLMDTYTRKLDITNYCDPKRWIVSTYQGSNNWYYVCNDGWCEQGGYFTGISGKVTLLRPYVNTYYQVNLSYEGVTNATNTQLTWHSINSKTTSSFVITNSAGTSFTRTWTARGYSAVP